MSLRRWKNKFKNAGKAISDKVSGAVESVQSSLKADTSFEGIQNELIKDMETGVRIFDEIDLPEEVGDEAQEKIVEFAIEKLKEAWPKRIVEEE